jgi:hypothetical protein
MYINATSIRNGRYEFALFPSFAVPLRTLFCIQVMDATERVLPLCCERLRSGPSAQCNKDAGDVDGDVLLLLHGCPISIRITTYGYHFMNTFTCSTILTISTRSTRSTRSTMSTILTIKSISNPFFRYRNSTLP